MSLLGSAASFQPKVYAKTQRCPECRKKIPAGTPMLVSIRNGRVQKTVCSEECRLTWDDKYWQGVAYERKMGAR